MDSNLSYSCQTGRHDILQQKGNVMFIIIVTCFACYTCLHRKNKYYSETYAFHFINVWRKKIEKGRLYIAVKVLVRSNLTFTSQK